MSNRKYSARRALRLTAITMAAQACLISHSAFALQYSDLTPPQAMMTVVNNSSCLLEPGPWVDGSQMWKEEFISGQSYVKSKVDWENESDPFNQWLEPNHTKSSWQKNDATTAGCSGPANATGVDPFSKLNMANNASGTYTIGKDYKVSWDPNKSSIDGGDDYRLFNACLVYQHSIHKGATKDANSEFNIGFKNVCNYPVPLRDFYIAPADDASKNLLDESINLYLPSWTASASTTNMDPNNPPHLGYLNFKNNAAEAYHVVYTSDWNKDGKTVVQPGATFSIGSYAQGSDWLANINNDNGGNFYVYNKVISSAEATPDNTVQFYPSASASDLSDIDQNQQTYATITTTGDKSMSAPTIIGATTDQPERVSFQSSLGGDAVAVTDLSIHMQAIKLKNKASDGNDYYLWQGADTKQKVTDNTVQPIKLTEQEANGQITVKYIIKNLSSGKLPADLPASVIDISNADNQSSEQNITLSSSGSVGPIKDLLPETATVSFQSAYYNDAVHGVFWNFIPVKNSMNVDLSTSPSDTISNTYQASEIDSQAYTVDLDGMKTLASSDNLYLYFSDLTSSDIPAIAVKLSDIKNSKVYLRSGDTYSAVLIQAKSDAQGAVHAGQKTFTDPDNDKVLLDGSGALWRSQVSITDDKITASVFKYQPEFAPYKDMGTSPSLPDDSTNYPEKDAVTLAFVTADTSAGASCQYQLAGYTFDQPVDGSTSGTTLSQQLKNYKHDYYISFGGEAGTMLSTVCKPKDLLDTYNKIYKQVKGPHFKGFDYDIEGGAQSDPNLLANLPIALKAFHSQHPGAEIWLTLPAMPYGLTGMGMGVVKDIANKQAGLTGVSIMTMDYGSASGDKKSMGQLAIDAAEQLHDQLSTVYSDENADNGYSTNNSSKLYTMIVDTPMTGTNDTGEIFTPTDASTLLSWAKSLDYNIGGIRFWSLNRDQDPASISSSDAPYAYTSILSQIVDGSNPPPPPGVNPTVTGELTKDVTGAGSIVKKNSTDGIITFTLKNGEADKKYLVQQDVVSKDAIFQEVMDSPPTPCSSLTTTNPTCKMDITYTGTSPSDPYPSDKGASADVPFNLYPSGESTSLDSTSVTVKADPISGVKAITADDVTVAQGDTAPAKISESGYQDGQTTCDTLIATGLEDGVKITQLDSGSLSNGVCTYNATVTAEKDAEATTKAITVTDSTDTSATSSQFNLTVTGSVPPVPGVKAITADDVTVAQGDTAPAKISESGYQDGQTTCDTLIATGLEDGVKITQLDSGSLSNGVCTYNATVTAEKDAEATTKAITVTDSTDTSATSSQFNLTVTGSVPPAPGTNTVTFTPTGNGTGWSGEYAALASVKFIANQLHNCNIGGNPGKLLSPDDTFTYENWTSNNWRIADNTQGDLPLTDTITCDISAG